MNITRAAFLVAALLFAIVTGLNLASIWVMAFEDTTYGGVLPVALNSLQIVTGFIFGGMVRHHISAD